MKKMQSGLSLIGFIVMLVLVGTVALVAFRAVPAHHEFFSVQRVLKDTLQEVGDGGSRTQFGSVFDRRAQIDDITSVRGSDIQVSKADGRTILTVQYEKRQPLIGYASIVFDFQATAGAK
jgi:Domain of unknown function (DUF4845)